MKFNNTVRFIAILILILLVFSFKSNDKNKFSVIAYYTGDANEIEKYPIEKLTHIIYSFLHLKGNKLVVDDSQDSTILSGLTSLKKKYPDLKVLISLGGWGGCKTCSDVFSLSEGRREFALSVKDLLVQYHADGIDLDWEYPAIKGFPGHPFKPEDKDNFTMLVEELRNTLGSDYEISFAAGGFTSYIKESINWKQVIPLVDRVNIMTYDLYHGYSIETGHHTPLFSNDQQIESTDHAVKLLSQSGVPYHKMVIGAAFYGRIWENVQDQENGIYQPGKFKRRVGYKKLDEYLSLNKGYEYFWDSTSYAPYMYNPELKLFLTYDDSNSITYKTKYALDKHLGGIMFWELKSDLYKGGLLDVIYSAINQ